MSPSALIKRSTNGCQYPHKPRGDEHILSSKNSSQKLFICVKCDYLKIRPQTNGSGAQVRSSHCVSKPIFKHWDSVQAENLNEVILANSFIIQADLFLWIRTEVCIFINDPGGFRRSWNILCISQRGREHLFHHCGHSVQNGSCGKCDGPGEVAWIAIRRSLDRKQNLTKGTSQFSQGLFSVCVSPNN